MTTDTLVLPPPQLRSHLDSSSLHLILLPTEACNFRCVYCYESFAHGRMEPEVVQGLERLLERRASELRLLTLSWFGGEPLLAPDILVRVHQHVRALQRQHPHMELFGDITTNAYHLTRERFQELLGLGVRRYQISFDGPREFHDRRRLLADGGGTFDRIWSHVLALRDVPGRFEVLLRVHVDRDNQAAMPEFVAQCEAAFGHDARFHVDLRRLTPMGGPNDGWLPFLEEQERKPDAGSAAGAPPETCYAARANSFVVRADGRVNKCTVALDHPANQVGRLHDDGRLEIHGHAMQPWLRGLWSGDAVELGCPARGWIRDQTEAAPGIAV